jgi:cytochrome c biogenesis protein CcmG/thiol:disulfide interchange protein DsbE
MKEGSAMNGSVVRCSGKAVVWAFLLAGTVMVSFAQAQEEMTPIPMISGIEMLKVGAVAPDFALKDLKGGAYDLGEVLKTNKGVVVFFWSIFCEPCKAELPVIQELTNTYREKGIDFTGIILDGVPMKEAVAAFIKQENYSFRTLLDEKNEDESFVVSDPYGVAGTPTLYILDAKRVVKFSVVGRETKEKLEAAIKSLL